MDKNQFYFHADIAKKVLKAFAQKKETLSLSLDLNISTAEYGINNDTLILNDKLSINHGQIKKIAKKSGRVFLFDDKGLHIIEHRNGGYYKLVPTGFAPTFEISGVKMHRSKDYDPFIDSKEKAQEVVQTGHHVLDTCGGLGYTAIWAVRLGARKVVTIERDPVVRKIRQQNPWSAELCSEKIDQISGDSFLYLKKVNKGSFDSIIHDPPRFSLSGELYGREFYGYLHRALKKGGKLFHYTGNPYQQRKGSSFLMNAAKRLKESGFGNVVPKPEYLGILAVKQ